MSSKNKATLCYKTCFVCVCDITKRILWHHRQNNKQNRIQGNRLFQINDKYITFYVLSWMLCVHKGITDFFLLLYQTCLIATFRFKDDQRLLPANRQTRQTLITNVRSQCLEWWQWAVGSNTLHSWLFIFLNFWIVNKRSDWQQILNQVGTKKALETIMNMQLFLREATAESNEISWNKSYGLSCNETINTFFTNMKRHFQFFIVRCWLLYYSNLPTCTMGV